MPPPNNPTNSNSVPWSPIKSAANPDPEIVNGKFTDGYGFQSAAQPPVWYLQFYWAWGFTAPDSSIFTLPTVTGVNDGSMPGISGFVIPLMIKTKNPATAFESCSMFGAQGVLLTTQYIAINGEPKPATPSWCPAELGNF